ncbi:TetR family transcriptional regulator [Dietzia sp. UCD-THP]|uniref:TetR/AcrR family transcriptional regulator n=1 Tax=Dietzia sp. UCD-THP TaxID=1292020 RepID=UPI000437B554|nr:TetR family transcriptional regulator [Dietzia sp. UCD-THP]EYT61992.1 TetR family transcriptional regulator [Dietzia sp. UCD-THP]
MARSVKGRQRQRDIVEAALRLIARGGLQAASVRGVATESEMSAGAVRHFFPTQEALLEHVMADVTAKAARRLVPLIRALDDATTAEGARVAACALLEELLPLDEPRRVEWFLWSAVADSASFPVALDRWREAGWAGARHQCRRVIGHLHGTPVPPFVADPDDGHRVVASTATIPELSDPALEARVTALHAALDGLAAQLTATPAPIDAASARRALRELVGVL